MRGYEGDPDRFVAENGETLVRLLKHGDDEFVRALALAVLIEYGDDPHLEDIEREIARVRKGVAS